MPFVPVDKTAMVEVRMDLKGQSIENTLYFKRADAVSLSNLAALANDVFLWWTGGYDTLVSPNCRLKEIVCTDLTSAIGPSFTLDGGDNTGSLSGFELPNNAAICVSFRTGNRGRSFRGRNYVSGLTDAVMADTNVITSGYSTNLRTVYAQLLPEDFDLAWTWVVVSRYSGVNPTTKKPIPRTTGLATPVLSVTLTDPYIDSQRGRLPTRGN